MTPTTSDPALFLWEEADGVEDLLGTYAIDRVLGGNEAFQVQAKSTLRRLDVKIRRRDDFEFLGVTVASTRGPEP